MIKVIILLFALLLGFIYCLVYLAEKIAKKQIEKFEIGVKVSLSYIFVFLVCIACMMVTLQDLGIGLIAVASALVSSGAGGASVILPYLGLALIAYVLIIILVAGVNIVRDKNRPKCRKSTGTTVEKRKPY